MEDTKLISASEDGQTEIDVEIMVAPQPNQDVRPIGFDIPMGSTLVDKGNNGFIVYEKCLRYICGSQRNFFYQTKTELA